MCEMRNIMAEAGDFFLRPPRSRLNAINKKSAAGSTRAR